MAEYHLTAHKRPEEGCSTADFGAAAAEKIRHFHQSFPEYAPTPLRNLKNLAEQLGVSDICVKDESFRFGLNAFKVLGSSWAVGQYIAERLGIPSDKIDYQTMVSPEAKRAIGDLTLVTATDGNHGRGVAWTADRLGIKSIVYMPKGTAVERLENIRKLGSHAEITEFGYDDCVRLAKKTAEAENRLLVQDTDSDDYQKIPRHIMQGYTTMALEAVEQWETLRKKAPTHILLQAGVGAMAGALTGFFADYYRDAPPKIIIVEPNSAGCIYKTAKAGDGRLHCVEGEMNTIMAGLACGVPCAQAWEILRDHADFFATIPETTPASGMRILANPLGDDPRVISGESGASTFGYLTDLLRLPELVDARNAIGFDGESRILCISTEGATDRKNYLRVVWDGAWGRG